MNLDQFKIYIRDDDLCSFTDFKIFNEALKFYTSYDLNVIFGVVPNASLVVDNYLSRDYINTYEKKITENRLAISYINHLSSLSNQFTFFMHGYNHEYNNDRLGEFGYIQPLIARSRITQGISILNDDLKLNVKGFIPPSNVLSYANLLELSNFFSYVSYCMPHKYIIKNNKTLKDFLFNKILHFSSNRVIPISLSNTVIIPYISISASYNNDEEIVKFVQLCRLLNKPCTIATHYWEIAKNPGLQKRLLKIIDSYVS